MEQSKLQVLKSAVNNFYINTNYKDGYISDQEYDELVKEYEAETGESVKYLVDWPEQLVLDNEPEDPLDKTIVQDNNLVEAVKSFLAESGEDDLSWINLKYDGGAIKFIYDESGDLQRIQSTPDEKQGIVRTEQFWNLVPLRIDPSLGIKCIRGEVLVDPEVYGKLARNKANGLINSTVSQEEITKEAFIRWYKLTYFDGNWSCKRQLSDRDKIPEIGFVRDRFSGEEGKPLHAKDIVFAPAYNFKPDECPTDAIVSQDNGDCFQADGVVVYSEKLGIKGFKFYFTDYAITTVKDVIWNRQSNGSFAAVLSLDPITLDDKYIQKASSNGVPKMIRDHCGVGAKVKVILANTTIPKVVGVLEPSDNFNFPKCECGYQLSEKDIFGSVLKCGNTDICIDKVNRWSPQVAQWLLEEEYLFGDCSTVEEAILKNSQWFGYLLFVDRWDPFNDGVFENIDIDDLTNSEYLLNCVRNKDLNGFRVWVQNSFKFTELQWDTVEINLASSFQVLLALYEQGTFKKIKELINYQ